MKEDFPHMANWMRTEQRKSQDVLSYFCWLLSIDDHHIPSWRTINRAAQHGHVHCSLKWSFHSKHSAPHISWTWLRIKCTGVEAVQALSVVNSGLLVLEPTNLCPCSHSLWALIFTSNTKYPCLMNVNRRAGIDDRFLQIQSLHTEFFWSLGFWTQRPEIVLFCDIPLLPHEWWSL